MSEFYVTTPIYYVNGAPHLGHAYTTVIADALARYHRLKGDDVFFLTGTDEHGLKIQRAAEDHGISPQALVDENSAKFRSLFDALELTYDRFIRTTDDDHRRTVETIVQRMKDSDDIYLDKYEGWYSASDEAYYDESEIEDGKAIASGSEVEWVEEESYFFRLSNYEDQLLAWYEEHAHAVAPESRKNEIRTFVEGGLNDLSISRTTFDWGIPMPDDPDHVLYVWVDALTNYITAIGAFEDEARFERYWPADVHLIGKDILRFHAVYWPAFLLSANLELPRQVFAHGWWTVEGEKMSKSKGNWIDAFELVDTYDLDVLRYYLLREVTLGNDGNFSHERLVERNNAELADNIGNLVNRTLSMSAGFVDGKVPNLDAPLSHDDDLALRDAAIKARDEVETAVQERALHNALSAITTLAKKTNNYIQTVQPWSHNKKGNQRRLDETLYTALESIRFVATLLQAFVPDAAAHILDGLGVDDRGLESLQQWGGLEGNTAIEKPEVLFDKLETPEPAENSDEDTGDDDADDGDDSSDDDEDGANLVSFDQVMAVEMRVGQILDAQGVDGADKLLKLTVDVGDDPPRTVVAGIATSFAPDELIDLKVTMVTNLEPAKLFGIESQAMVLAAKKEDGQFALATFADDVPAGTSVS